MLVTIFNAKGDVPLTGQVVNTVYYQSSAGLRNIEKSFIDIWMEKEISAIWHLQNLVFMGS